MGDAFTTRNVLTGETAPRPAPFTLDPEQAVASLARLDDLRARWVLPGHGDPWDGGLTEALRQIRANGPRTR
jgi:glyoxylase-like metal-dependent hydrolase (beta-lactamase superfamily II)